MLKLLGYLLLFGVLGIIGSCILGAWSGYLVKKRKEWYK